MFSQINLYADHLYHSPAHSDAFYGCKCTRCVPPLKAVMEVTEWQCAYIFCSIQFILFNCEQFAPINEKQQAQASRLKRKKRKPKQNTNSWAMIVLCNTPNASNYLQISMEIATLSNLLRYLHRWCFFVLFLIGMSIRRDMLVGRATFFFRIGPNIFGIVLKNDALMIYHLLSSDWYSIHTYSTRSFREANEWCSAVAVYSSTTTKTA